MELLKKENRLYLKIIIILCLIVSSSVGLGSNTVGVFYSYVCEDLNILRGSYIIHNTIAALMLAVVAVWVPKIMNSKNFKYLIFFASLATGVGTACMSLCNNLLEFYILGFIRGSGTAFFAFVVVSIIINHWFYKDHGFITSIIFAFSGIAGAIFAPLMINIIESYGWRIGYICLGILFIVLVAPLLFSKFTFYPEEMGLTAYGAKDLEVKKETKKANNNTSKLLFVFVAIFAGFIHLGSALMQHLTPLGQYYGYSIWTVSMIVSMSQVGNVVSKFLAGKISDKKGALYSNIIFLIVSIIGALLLYFSFGSFFMILGGFLFGSVFAETAVGLTLVTNEYFGQDNYDKYYPILALIGNLSYAIGTSLDGYIYDFTGSYNLVIYMSIILILICIISLFLGKKELKNRL